LIHASLAEDDYYPYRFQHGGKEVNISLGQCYKLLFGISMEATFLPPGLRESKAWQRMETVSHAFVYGYHAALEDSRFEMLVPRLNIVETELRGLAFEGAAMGLTLLDCLLPRKNRLLAFLAGPGSPHMYLLNAGAGIAFARLRRRPEPLLAQLDPLVSWAAIDGYGFHEGFFSWHRSIQEKMIPVYLSGYARRVFDQGLGRSLWFTTGADIKHIAATIATFPSSRHADLWSGVGVACAYLGGTDRTDIEALRTLAEPYRFHLAQGATIAAKARQRANNPAPHTNLACEVLCGCSSDMAAHIVDVAWQNMPLDSVVEPAYEIWRKRIQQQFAAEQRVSE
jgi:hypothetical protein